MPPRWRFELVERILRIDLTEGIDAADFERLYDGILQQIADVDGVLIDLGDTTLSATARYLLDSMIANLRARDVATSVLRLHDLD